MARRREGQIRVRDFVPVVGDGAIAGPVLEGVNVPLLILDTTTRPDIAELIRVHEFLPPGDVVSTWGGLHGQPQTVLLVLDFQRPIEARAVLSFEIASQGMLIELALTARAMYLQAGRPGDRIIHDPSRPKLLIELPESEFKRKWDELFRRGLTDSFRQEFGLPKRVARERAAKMIEELRAITTFRMPRR